MTLYKASCNGKPSKNNLIFTKSNGKSVLRLSPFNRAKAREMLDAAPDGWHFSVKEPTRSLDANAAMWAALTDVSRQVIWHGRKLTPEQWKHIFTASLKRQDVVPNLDGDGFVVLGVSTSRMTIREMSDLIELIRAFGAGRGVRFTAPEREAA